MAIQSGNITLEATASQKGTIGIAEPIYAPTQRLQQSFSNGTNAENRFDLVGSYIVTFTGGNDDIDFRAGVLVDANNDPIDPAQVVYLGIEAPSGNANNFTVDGTIANGIAFYKGGTFKPGDLQMFVSKLGHNLTSGTADLLRFVGTAGQTAKILVFARSAAYVPA